MMRRTRIRPVSKKRAAQNKIRAVVVDAMYEAKPWCPRCGTPTPAMAGHERRGRAQGGDIIAPETLLCHACNQWCEDQPIVAAFTGWKVSGKHSHAPGLQVGQAIDLAGNLVTFYTETETP